MVRSRRFWYGVALGVGIAWWLGRRHPGYGKGGGVGGPQVQRHSRRPQYSGLRRFRA